FVAAAERNAFVANLAFETHENLIVPRRRPSNRRGVVVAKSLTVFVCGEQPVVGVPGRGTAERTV
ncbi:MAG: hypothetical protein ACRC1K_08625, partial [Planctomycetia bacterium]